MTTGRILVHRDGPVLTLELSNPGKSNALDWGMLTELDDDPLERCLEIAQGLASFPQQTMLADRRAAIEGFGMSLEDGLALEAKAGPETLQAAVEGANRFAGGEGRSGAGAGV